MIIGVTGHPAAGKDSVAEYFKMRGFLHVSMGDFLREIMKEKNIPIDRPHIREFVTEMRAKHGNGYPAKEIAGGITGDTVVTGFRNMAEVEAFRKIFSGTFVLVAIDAAVEIRYERIRERKRVGDDISLERFKEEENEERAQASGTHEVDRVMAAADHLIENNGTKEEFFKKLDHVLK